ncbi:unnamed protein product [Camellia sinensis]
MVQISTHPFLYLVLLFHSLFHSLLSLALHTKTNQAMSSTTSATGTLIFSENPQPVQFTFMFSATPSLQTLKTTHSQNSIRELPKRMGKGIFNVDGDSWKFQRKMASLELGSVSIRSYAFEIVSLEIQTRLTPLLSSHAAQKGNILDLQDRAMAASPLIWKLKRALNLGTEKKLKQAMKIVDLLAEEMIKNRRKMGFSTQKDLLSRFMGTIDDDQYLRDIVISFLVAGRDTVASGLTSFFGLLAQHPEVEKAIRDESDRVMGLVGQSGPAQELSNFDQMREMHYLQAAIYESMRPYPPVQFDSKFCEEDDTLPDGTFVRKGTKVTYHPYAMGRMERVWGPNNLKFMPERWLQSGVFTPVSPFKYPVFQAGLRVCLGKGMALVAMKSVAISLIWPFDIQVVTPSQALTFVPGLTATVRGGLPVVISERRD